MNEWTDEQIYSLKTRWAAGDSAGMIARDQGRTRNAVLGKINRLKLIRPHALREPRTIRNQRAKQPSARFHVAGPSPIDTEQQPDMTNCKTLAELCPHHCRYPLLDGPPFLYCGDMRLEPHPYCAKHYRIAYSQR